MLVSFIDEMGVDRRNLLKWRGSQLEVANFMLRSAYICNCYNVSKRQSYWTARLSMKLLLVIPFMILHVRFNFSKWKFLKFSDRTVTLIEHSPEKL